MTTAQMVASSTLVSAANAGTTGLMVKRLRTGCALRPALRWQGCQGQRAAFPDLAAHLSRAFGLTRAQACREGLRHD